MYKKRLYLMEVLIKYTKTNNQSKNISIETFE